MRTPARWLRAAALATAASLLTPALVAVVSPTGAAAASGQTTLRPGVVSLSSAEIANPMRGQYRWMGQGSQPSSWATTDSYYRDQVYWGRLEPQRGTYDFRHIETGLADAASTGGKFGFRVMAYCPGCWMDQRDTTDWPRVTPSFIPRQPGTEIPNWNSETFLSSWEALMAELGRRYGNDPRLGYVDVGGFGKYGEWMPAGTDITAPNAMRLIGAVATAFPKKHVLLSAVPMWTKRPDVTGSAVTTYPNLGLRSDCLGQRDMQVPTAEFANLWKTRPFFTEWCTGGDPTIAKDQVATYHVATISSGNLRRTYKDMTAAEQSAYELATKTSGYRYSVTEARFSHIAPGGSFTLGLSLTNAGSAPTYERWTTRLVLRDSSGGRVATLPLSLDLRTRLPGSTTYSQKLTAPALPEGSYTAALEVVDPEGYLQPMRLANTGRDIEGAYPLGTVPVGGAETGQPPVLRLSGEDRYAASAAISADTFSPGVPVAYVATGEKFPDALSGAPAAGVEGGPVLLVRSSSIPTAISDELTRLAPQRIIVLGGPNSVSTSVAHALKTFTTGGVTRLAGEDRYAASAAISADTFSPGVPVAYVATGEKFPDALSGAPAAGVAGGPVLLVRSSSIPTAISDELTRLAPQRIIVLGGPNSVSTSVAHALKTFTTGGVTRLAGEDRYAASAAISADTFSPGVPVAYVATGEKFPDALSGAPAAGVAGGPVLLVRSSSIPTAISDELTRLAPQRIIVLGGPNSVSTSVADALASYATG